MKLYRQGYVPERNEAPHLMWMMGHTLNRDLIVCTERDIAFTQGCKIPLNWEFVWTT